MFSCRQYFFDLYNPIQLVIQYTLTNYNKKDFHNCWSNLMHNNLHMYFTCGQNCGPIIGCTLNVCNFKYMKFMYIECNICTRKSMLKVNRPAFNFKYSVYKCNLILFLNPLKCKEKFCHHIFYVNIHLLVLIFVLILSYSFGEEKTF